jgi:hypothetical protein
MDIFSIEITKNWIISAILGGALFSFVFMKPIKKIFKFFKDYFNAKSISRKILNKNRYTLGNGSGKHLADRFLKIWHSNKTETKGFYIESGLVENSSIPSSRIFFSAIDEELEKLRLIKIENNFSLPIRNTRNKLVAKFTKNYLIKFIGDNSEIYKNMEKKVKRNNKN